MLLDINAKPSVFQGWEIALHQGGDGFDFSKHSLELHFSSNQQGVHHVKGSELRKELESVKTCNATLLDFLLKNPSFIPQKWKNYNTCFWGTVYRNNRNLLCVRTLRFDGDSWEDDYVFITDVFGKNFPAAVMNLRS